MNWQEAFYHQAASDYAMLRRLTADREVDDCQRLHYLQMTSEKLAKAFLTPTTGGSPRKSHAAFVRLLRHPTFERLLGRTLGWSNVQIKSFTSGIMPLAQQIEDLAPTGDEERPNPEYPWRRGNDVIAPVNYNFDNLSARQPKVQKMIKFLGDWLIILEMELR